MQVLFPNTHSLTVHKVASDKLNAFLKFVAILQNNNSIAGFTQQTGIPYS